MVELVHYIQEHKKTHIIFDFDATLFLLVLPWTNFFDGLKEKLCSTDASMWSQTKHHGFSRG